MYARARASVTKNRGLFVSGLLVFSSLACTHQEIEGCGGGHGGFGDVDHMDIFEMMFNRGGGMGGMGGMGGPGMRFHHG